MKIFFYSCFLAGALFPGSSGFVNDIPGTFQFDYENVLGTSFQLKIDAASEKVADQAEQIALDEIDRLSGILSTYDETSEISLWQKTRNVDVHVSAELFEVFDLFDHWKLRTSGALTASIATAADLWKEGERNQMTPSNQKLATAVVIMQEPQWNLNASTGSASHLGNSSLLFNSFVKSYIIGKVSEKLLAVPGVTGVVTNIGGDIVVAGNHTENISVANPDADAENDFPVSVVSLHQRAIATSGNYRRGYQIGNQWYSHIIDPRTALPVSGISSATVVADNAVDAGALATAFNVLSLEESKTLATTMPGVEYKIITATGDIIESEGMRRMEIATTPTTKSIRAVGKKLTINLELATFEGRSRRPFVAAWIENKKKESVKTVALWYNKPRWLPDLKRWYAKNQSILGQSSQSISSATRSAGKYEIVWDGLDERGKEVPSGKYTVYIEAAREHGTYQLIKQEIEWNGKAKHFDLQGGVEITAASLDLAQ